MPYRMLLADLDGTVLTSEGRVSQRTADALRRLRASDWRVVLATGRCWRSSQPVAVEIGLGEPVICVNGALVKESPSGRTVAMAALGTELLGRVAETLRGLGQSFFVHVDAPDGRADALLVPGPTVAAETRRYLELAPWSAEVADLAAVGPLKERCIEVSVWASAEAMARCREALETALPGRVRTLTIYAPNVEMMVFEVFAAGVNKWAAAEQLARSWGIASGEIVAVGDDVNDVEMIARAGLGVAMGNASATVRGAALRATGSHDEDGLALLVDELLALR